MTIILYDGTNLNSVLVFQQINNRSINLLNILSFVKHIMLYLTNFMYISILNFQCLE